jgi:hypothetical protein
VLAQLGRVRARLRAIGLLWAGAAGAAVCAGVLVTLSLAGIGAFAALGSALATGVVAGVLSGVTAWRRWTAAAAAERLERVCGTLDNLVVTSVQMSERPGRILPFIRDAVAEQAASRLSAVDCRRVIPAARPAGVFLTTITGAGLLMWTAARTGETGTRMAGLRTPARDVSIERVEVVVTPPGYARLAAETVVDPSTVSVLAGSRVRLAVISRAAEVTLVEAGAAPAVLSPSGPLRAVELVADRSRILSITSRTGDQRDDRLVAIVVRPDGRPLVRIGTPGKDVMLTAARPVDLRIETADDLALQSLALRYTRVSGSGESFTFADGEVPLVVTRVDERNWTASARWAIEALRLEDGDALVYRAVARDTNPAGDEVSSDSYLIEIGAPSDIAAAGFALPEDERRYGLSQQMVIVKTERLLADRSTLGRDDFAERARTIAVEQRMVKAEFIFLSGGEVEDEVIEAEHSHELVEGRLENVGRAEMLRAIAAMTRAEERLILGDAAAALVHERAALQALQRAFDRRRYFLRVMPERARIDASRRLSGSLADARPAPRGPGAPPEDGARAAARRLMQDLARGPADAALAARVAAVDPSSADWQRLAQAMMTGGDAGRRAVDAAMAALRTRVLGSLAPAPAESLVTDSYEGHLADAARRERGRR